MSKIEQQLAQIRRLQTFITATDTKADNSELNPLAFVMELDPPRTRSSLLQSLIVHLPGLVFSLETVFEEDNAPRFFRLEFKSVSFDDLSGSFFELSYYLQDILGLVSCDADLETDFHPWQFDRDIDDDAHEPPFVAVTGLSGLGAIKQLCFLPESDATKPPDQGWVLQATKVDKARAVHGVSGKGVILAQIDTGVAKHTELKNLTLNRHLGFNLYNSKKGAIDPLKNRLLGFFDQKGHGTATSAVIISEGGFIEDGDRLETTAPGLITGVAPDVEFMPIRAIRSVLRVSQGRVAKAIDLARRKGAHIITMSMGGAPSRALRHAIARAVEDNVIVMAAAGNCVKTVVYPAAYDHCIAVAAINRAGKRWRGSCRGSEVDFSAPGEFVWTARRKKHDDDSVAEVNAGQGTSFAVALTAGIAALWLEHNGRDELIASLGPNETLQSRFRDAAKDSAQTFPNWPLNTMGAGIIDAFALMEIMPRTPQTAFAGGVSAESNVVPSAQTIRDGDRLLSLLSAMNSKPQFASPFGGQVSAEGLDKYSAEILWRLMREQQSHLRSNDTTALPPRSSYLDGLIETLSPIIAADIP